MVRRLHGARMLNGWRVVPIVLTSERAASCLSPRSCWHEPREQTTTAYKRRTVRKTAAPTKFEAECATSETHRLVALDVP